VPLSTVALSSIARHQMADATGLNSLFRQVGGSIGLAIGATMLTRFGAQVRSALLAHLTGANPAAMERLRMMAGGFVARGYDATTARQMALRALDGTVQMQSTLLAFEQVFLGAGILFLVVLPLLIFLKTPQETSRPPGDGAVHVEV
jgi:DHA2 family multidrug resistance protein